MAADLSALGLLVVQIDGLHLGDDLVLVAAIGGDGEGNKPPLALVEGATRERRNGSGPAGQPGRARVPPTVPRLFIVDGAKALSKAIRRSFGSAAAIPRCQIHKARTSWNACRESIMWPPVECCARPGSSMTPTRLKN
jgi:hypothetical protein